MQLRYFRPARLILTLLIGVLLVSCGSAEPQVTQTISVPTQTAIPEIPTNTPPPTTQNQASTPTAEAASTDMPEGASAVLLIQFSDRDRIIRQIEFTDALDGVTALQATGAEVITADFGDSGLAVCSINGVGCPADNCFCSTKFWSYETWRDDAWQPYQTGPSGVSLMDGAVEGWRWGEFGQGSLPPPAAALAAAKAIDWIAEQQVSLPGGYDSPSSSLEVLLAIGSNGWEADQWKSSASSPSLLDYWRQNAPAFAEDGPASSGKLAVGLAGASGCWPTNTVQASATYTPTTGAYSQHAGFQAWAILGNQAISQTVPVEAIEFLKGLALPDGGWEWNTGFGSDTNTTALIIQTLLAAGEVRESAAIVNGLGYLKSAQNADGGFTYAPGSPFGTDSDVNSTAYAIQAIVAAGQDPQGEAWVMEGASPLSYLLSMQLPDGSFEWQKGAGANLVATTQAVTALLGRTYPLHITELPACP